MYNGSYSIENGYKKHKEFTPSNLYKTDKKNQGVLFDIDCSSGWCVTIKKYR